MKEKKGIANKFQIFFNSNGGNVEGRNSKSMQFLFLENCYKLSLQTRFKVFFQKEIPLVPVNFTFHIYHFTNWNGMNQSFPCTYGPI
jgi:hypothetical protein